MQEFVYYNPNGLEFPLDESILVVNSKENLPSNDFFISNTNEIESEVVSKEIDFYIRNTKDPLSKMIKTLPTLYDMCATQYDNTQDMEYTQDIQNKVLLIGDEEKVQEFLSQADEEVFDLYDISEDKLVSISGHKINSCLLVVILVS